MRVFKAPAPYLPDRYPPSPTVFLAGSIEQDLAVRWQDEFVEALDGFDMDILSPRRDHWDPTWDQSMSCPEFVEQVDWEMEQMMAADFVAMYFAPGTRSPVTLLELGLLAGSHKLTVCCPQGFWRKGNVDMVCSRFGIPMALSLQDLIDETKRIYSAFQAPLA